MTGWNGSIHPAAEIFPIPEEQLTDLVADIRRNGLLNPGTLLPDGTLLDGRMRRLACEAAGVEMRWVTYEGDDPVGYVVSQNANRRHLTTGQKAAIAADLEPLFAAGAAERRAQAPGQPRGHKKASVADDRPPQKSRDRAAQMVGTSGRSVTRYKRVARDAPDLAEKVKAGELPLEAAVTQSRRRKTEAEEASARLIKLGDARLPDARGERWEMRQGRFQDRLQDVPDATLDAIVTDPPYAEEFLSVWPDLACAAARVLKPHGLLIVLSGKMYLDKVMTALGQCLDYNWMYTMPLPGSQARIKGSEPPWVCWRLWLLDSNH